MARRRLNKKVALIGSAVVVFVLLVVIGAILRFGQKPEDFIRDAEIALTAARQATDERIKEKNYEKAARSFRGAFSRAKTDSLREEVLFKMLDMYLETKEWPFIRGCWDEIVKVNPNNAKARYGQLKYFYIRADSGFIGYWPEVYEQASEFLKVAEDTDLLTEDTAKWDVFELDQEEAARQHLGPYLYLIRGRAALEMADLRTAPERSAWH